jgi:uncharacterized Tic20 family protein
MEPITFAKDGNVILPQPDQITKKEKEDAMGAYLMMFAASALGMPLPLINLIASLIYYFLNNKKSRFVAFNAYQSMITHLFIGILNFGLLVWVIYNFVEMSKKNLFNDYFYLFLFFVVIWNLIYIVYSVIACVKAYRGEFFYMLFFGRVSFNKFYSKESFDKQNASIKKSPAKRNLPPKKVL